MAPPAPKLYEGVKRQLEAWSEAAFPYETGGILLGMLGDDEPWIVMAGQVRSKVPRFLAFEVPAGATQPAVEAARARDPRLGYLGDWHSHPLDARASPTDLGTFARTLQRALRRREPPPLMIVCRRTEGGWELDMLARTGRKRRAEPVSYVLTGPPPALEPQSGS